MRPEMPRFFAVRSDIPLPYVLGFLLHPLVSGEYLRDDDVALVSSNIQTIMSKGVVNFMRRSNRVARPVEYQIHSVMERIAFLTGDDEGTDGLPSSLTNSEWGSFWLGYYHARLGKTLEEVQENETATARLDMRVSPRLKNWILSEGGTAYVVALVEADKARRDTPKKENDK